MQARTDKVDADDQGEAGALDQHEGERAPPGRAGAPHPVQRQPGQIGDNPLFELTLCPPAFPSARTSRSTRPRSGLSPNHGPGREYRPDQHHRGGDRGPQRPNRVPRRCLPRLGSGFRDGADHEFTPIGAQAACHRKHFALSHSGLAPLTTGIWRNCSLAAARWLPIPGSRHPRDCHRLARRADAADGIEEEQQKPGGRIRELRLTNILRPRQRMSG